MKVKVVYHCYGSAHTSVTVAAIHAGLLPRERIPTGEELLAIPHFDRTPSAEIGTPFRMGFDCAGNEIFIVGRARGGITAERALRSLARVTGYPEERLLVVNALAVFNVWTAVGGMLSRRLGIVRWGRPIVIFGVMRSYPRLVALAQQTENAVLRIREEGDVRQEANKTVVVTLKKETQDERCTRPERKQENS